jgi:hypothetical protein
MYIDEDGEFALWLAMFKVKFDKSFYNHQTTLLRQNMAISESSVGQKGQNTTILGHYPR